MKKNVIVAGHICLDITPMFPGGVSLGALQPGHLVYMDGVTISTGGAVANTGLAMKFFGADVRLIGKLGNDKFGQVIRNITTAYGVRDGMIVAEEGDTSYTVVIAPNGMDRIFLHCPGVNDSFCAADLDFSVIREANLFHFGYPPLMKRMYEDDGRELIKVFTRVSKMKVVTSLDMAMISDSSPAARVDWKNILIGVLPFTDIFAPSFEEICIMLDPIKYRRLLNQARGRDMTECIDVKVDVQPLANEILRMGTGVVLIKCGAAGLYYATAGARRLGRIMDALSLDGTDWHDRNGFEEGYLPEKVLSATGAGDACIAGFLMAMLEGYSLVECVQLATAAGASCVEAYDSLSGLKPLSLLKAKIASGWAKRKKCIQGR